MNATEAKAIYENNIYGKCRDGEAVSYKIEEFVNPFTPLKRNFQWGKIKC